MQTLLFIKNLGKHVLERNLKLNKNKQTERQKKKLITIPSDLFTLGGS